MRFALTVFAAVAVCLLSIAEGQKVTCSLRVSPKAGESSVSGGSRSGLGSLSSVGSGSSKTIKRQLRWLAELRFREKRPEQTKLKVYYIGYGDGGKKIKLLKDETHAVELDKNGCAKVELESPMTTLNKTRSQTTSRGNGGFVSTKSSIRGERVAGCVVQVFADGELVENYSSDSRWAAVAKKVPFSVKELEEKAGRIGLR